MNRRGFLGALATAAATLALDPERLLWTPGEKKIFIPTARQVNHYIGWVHMKMTAPTKSWIDTLSGTSAYKAGLLKAEWHQMAMFESPESPVKGASLYRIGDRYSLVPEMDAVCEGEILGGAVVMPSFKESFMTDFTTPPPPPKLAFLDIKSPAVGIWDEAGVRPIGIGDIVVAS